MVLCSSKQKRIMVLFRNLFFVDKSGAKVQLFTFPYYMIFEVACMLFYNSSVVASLIASYVEPTEQ